MSKPLNQDSAPTARPMARGHRSGRLHENFKVAGRIADTARSAIIEGLREHPAVAQIVRTAPPAILDLWEVIPSRTADAIRRRTANVGAASAAAGDRVFQSSCFPAGEISGSDEKGRRRAIEGRFGQRLARIWRGLNLHVGRAFDGAELDRHIESNFQRFGRLALTAVGDDSRISSRRIENLKSRSSPQLKNACFGSNRMREPTGPHGTAEKGIQPDVTQPERVRRIGRSVK